MSIIQKGINCEICKGQKKYFIACKPHCSICHDNVPTHAYSTLNICQKCIRDIVFKYVRPFKKVKEGS